jgi:type II secretory pathway pseudopilin PulG
MGRPRRCRRRPARRARGIVLVALLLAMLLAAVLTMSAAETWATGVRREREVELLFAGAQYRTAIRRYYYAAPNGQPRTLPTRLEDLLEDRRYPVPVRHLRRLYPDPITGSAEWGLALAGGRIAGVYSNSDDKPLRQAGFEPTNASFEGRAAYKEWVFMFVPPTAGRR